MSMFRKYGFLPQKLDDRDIHYSLPKPGIIYPGASDLRFQIPPCYNQLDTQACTYHGVSGALQSAQFVARVPVVMPSRLFGYFNTRAWEGDPQVDNGASIRNSMKVTNVYGFLPESEWAFDESKVLIKPPQAAYDQAAKQKIRFYAVVDLTNINNIKLPLSHGYPVIFGFKVYEYFESQGPNGMATKGILNLPGTGEAVMGWHCALIVGHDDSNKRALIRNSWGTKWGILYGHFWMSYDYFVPALVQDGWMLRF